MSRSKRGPPRTCSNSMFPLLGWLETGEGWRERKEIFTKIDWAEIAESALIFENQFQVGDFNSQFGGIGRESTDTWRSTVRDRLNSVQQTSWKLDVTSFVTRTYTSALGASDLHTITTSEEAARSQAPTARDVLTAARHRARAQLRRNIAQTCPAHECRFYEDNQTGRNDRSERWDGSLKRQLQPAADFFEPAASAGIRILLQTEIEDEQQRRNVRTLSASPLQRARRRRMPPQYITVASFRERPSRSAKREKRNCVGHAPVGATTRAPVGRAPHTDTHTQILSRLPAFQPPRMNRTPRRQIPRCRYFRSTAFADRVGRKPEIADAH